MRGARASRLSARKEQKPLMSPCGICFLRGRTRRRSCESVTRPGKPWIEDDLVRELARAGLAEKTAEMCARLCWDVDWSAKSPLSAWLKAIRSFYLPRV